MAPMKDTDLKIQFRSHIFLSLSFIGILYFSSVNNTFIIYEENKKLVNSSY